MSKFGPGDMVELINSDGLRREAIVQASYYHHHIVSYYDSQETEPPLVEMRHDGELTMLERHREPILKGWLRALLLER